MRILSGLLLRLQKSSLIRPKIRRLILNAAGADIHYTAVVMHDCIFHSADITMERGSLINVLAFYDGAAPILIKEDAQVGPGAMFITGSHVMGDTDKRASIDYSQPIVVGKGCWIGARSTILPGIEIANGSVIGAGAVVSRNTEADRLYLGMVNARYARELS